MKKSMDSRADNNQQQTPGSHALSAGQVDEKNITLKNPSKNRFISGSLPLVFLKTALPIIIIMLVNGTYTLVDAYFLGAFVGPQALSAVTSMFPAFMTLVALSTLVSNGFSSVIARLKTTVKPT